MIFMGRSSADLGTTVEYLAPSGFSTPDATESDVTMQMPRTCVVADLYVELSATPGGAETRTFTLMEDSVATNLACTISDPATSCNGTGTTSLDAGSDVSLRSASTAGAAAASVRFGWTCR